MRQLLFLLFPLSADAFEERAHLRRAGAEGDSLLVNERVANGNSSIGMTSAHAAEPNSSIAAQKAAPQEARAESRDAPRNTTMNASDIKGVVDSTRTAAGTNCDTTPLAGSPTDGGTIDQLLYGRANASDWESYDSDVMWAYEVGCREAELRRKELAG